MRLGLFRPSRRPSPPWPLGRHTLLDSSPEPSKASAVRGRTELSWRNICLRFCAIRPFGVNLQHTASVRAEMQPGSLPSATFLPPGDEKREGARGRHWKAFGLGEGPGGEAEVELWAQLWRDWTKSATLAAAERSSMSSGFSTDNRQGRRGEYLPCLRPVSMHAKAIRAVDSNGSNESSLSYMACIHIMSSPQVTRCGEKRSCLAARRPGSLLTITAARRSAESSE